MSEFILSILAVIRVFFRSRKDTALEVLALRQQLAVLKRKPPRPPLRSLDRLFWTMLRRFWSRWAEVLVIVKPSTLSAGIAPDFGSTGAGALANSRRRQPPRDDGYGDHSDSRHTKDPWIGRTHIIEQSARQSPRQPGNQLETSLYE